VTTDQDVDSDLAVRVYWKAGPKGAPK